MPARAKLPPGEGKRTPLNMRTTRELRERLEREAADSGRSLVQEVEFRLERSFRDEDALIKAFGGRRTYDVLRVMGSVASQIQTRKGKTAADWKTGVAIGRAWKRLIHDWLPKPPAEWVAELDRLFDAVPEAPVPPKPPKEPIRGGLLVPRASEEEWKAFEASRQDFIKDAKKHLVASTKHKRDYDQARAALRRKLNEFNKALEIGEEALGLLSDQDK